MLRDTPHWESISGLAQALGQSRRQVYRDIDPLVQVGLVDDACGISLSPAGEQFFLSYDQAPERIGREAINYVAGSPHRLSILSALNVGVSAKRDLLESSSAPSRTTVHRTIAAYTLRGWVDTDDAHRLHLTETGRTVLKTFEWLLLSTQQAIEKAAFLGQLDPTLDLPLSVLADSVLITEAPGRPFAFLDASLDAADVLGSGVNHIRMFVPLFNSVMFSEFEPLITRETTFEVIYTSAAFRRLTNPRNVQSLAPFLLAPNVAIRVHPSPMMWGLGVYDETMMLASPTEANELAAIMGTTDALTRWANETFDRLWTESQTPPPRFVRWVHRTVSSA
jgi:predicted transcriptional regulator